MQRFSRHYLFDRMYIEPGDHSIHPDYLDHVSSFIDGWIHSSMIIKIGSQRVIVEPSDSVPMGTITVSREIFERENINPPSLEVVMIPC